MIDKEDSIEDLIGTILKENNLTPIVVESGSAVNYIDRVEESSKRIQLYRQGNPGGRYRINCFVSKNVFIEYDKQSMTPDARAIEVTNERIYFEGVEKEIDCGCCGDRWDTSNGEEHYDNCGRELDKSSFSRRGAVDDKVLEVKFVASILIPREAMFDRLENRVSLSTYELYSTFLSLREDLRTLSVDERCRNLLWINRGRESIYIGGCLTDEDMTANRKSHDEFFTSFSDQEILGIDLIDFYKMDSEEFQTQIGKSEISDSKIRETLLVAIAELISVYNTRYYDLNGCMYASMTISA